MELASLDAGKLLALMVFGGLFALAGLVLMFRPKPEGSSAKIELLGMKFESSSAGLLVFLTGAAFLALPIFAPEARSPAERVVTTDEPQPAEPEGEAASDPSPTGTIVLPTGPGASDSEPNEFVTSANRISFGTFYSGRIWPERDDIEDWLVLPLAGVERDEITLQIRNRGTRAVSGGCRVDVLNSREERIARVDFPAEGSSKHSTVFTGDEQLVYLRVHAWDPGWVNSCNYEIKVY